MKGNIKVVFDYEENKPRIVIKTDKSSDDMRDGMLRLWIEQNKNKYLYVNFLPGEFIEIAPSDQIIS